MNPYSDNGVGCFGSGLMQNLCKKCDVLMRNRIKTARILHQFCTRFVIKINVKTCPVLIRFRSNYHQKHLFFCTGFASPFASNPHHILHNKIQ